MFTRHHFLAALLWALPAVGSGQSVALPTDNAEKNEEIPIASLFNTEEGGGAIEPLSASDALMTLEDAEQIATVTEDLLPVSKHPLMLRMGVGAIADDNIYQMKANPVRDVILQYVGGFTYELHKNENTRLTVDYDFTGYHLLNHSENDNQDHAGKVSLGYNFTKLKVDFLGTYSHLTGAERQIGNFTNRDILAARTTLLYELGTKLNLRGELNYNSTDYKDLQSITDYSFRLGADYKIGSKTSLGLAGVYGVMSTTVGDGLAVQDRAAQQNAALGPLLAEQSASQAASNAQFASTTASYQAEQQRLEHIIQTGTPAETLNAQTAKAASTAQYSKTLEQAQATQTDTNKKNAAARQAAAQTATRRASARARDSEQYYKQLLLTASYEATGKLSFHLDTGLEFREYQGDAAASKRNDYTFRLSAGYKMRESTTLTLSASRQVEGAAAVLGAAVRRNNIQLGVDQDFRERLHLAVVCGYDMGTFESTRTDFQETRQDDYLFAKATLTYKLGKYSYVSLFYEFRNQNSSLDSLTYSNNRYGLQLGVNF